MRATSPSLAHPKGPGPVSPLHLAAGAEVELLFHLLFLKLLTLKSNSRKATKDTLHANRKHFTARSGHWSEVKAPISFKSPFPLFSTGTTNLLLVNPAGTCHKCCNCLSFLVFPLSHFQHCNNKDQMRPRSWHTKLGEKVTAGAILRESNTNT